MLSGWYEKLSSDTNPIEGLDNQKAAADFCIGLLSKNLGCGLLSEQGTGKTIITLAVIEKLNVNRVLIVTPKTSIHVTWLNRLGTAGYSVPHASMDGVCVVGYEFFRNNIKTIQKMSWDMVIFDEAQGLKARGSAQSRAARRLRLKVSKRMILSGTPIDESPIDMWAQMRLIEPEVFGDVWARPRKKPRGGRKEHYFFDEFCRPSGFMGKKPEFIAERMPEFLNRLSKHVYRIENRMEEAEFIEVPVELHGQQLDIYNQMERHGIVQFGTDKIKASLAPVRDMKCFQIVGGYLKAEDGAVYETGRAKQRKLAWLITKLNKPVVFCRFLAETVEVRKILRGEFNRVAILHGKIKDSKNKKERTQLIEDFQAGKIDALVCQERTGGVSIELTEGNELVFYSMGFSRINFEQIKARFRRFGQKRKVKIFLIVARDTIDEEPLSAIVRKGDTVNPIMDFLRRSSQQKELKMADAKKAVKKTAKKAATKPANDEFKFGVDYIAKKLDVSEMTARNKLRNAEITKAGKSYGWKTSAEADKVVAKLKAA